MTCIEEEEEEEIRCFIYRILY